jgi:tetratricopeptide (TPR) repeat protein
LSSIELENFEKKLNLKKASYDSERRKEILLRWAKVSNCKWLLDRALTRQALDAIKNQQFLPTPLNIKDFVKASYDVLDSMHLEDLMKQKSEETVRRFGDEIMRMEEDEKILFLAFPYVSGLLYVKLVEKVYESIIISNPKSNQKYYMDFERVKKWFEDDKIDVSRDNIVYSHPSYYEAFQYAIDSSRYQSARVRCILSKLLLELVQKDETAYSVARVVANNFDKLPPNVQQLLFKLADNDKATVDVLFGITRNFDKLPPNVQQLLFKLADNDKTAGRVAWAVDEYFGKLPANIREKLLIRLVKKDKAAEDLAWAIASNFDKLPANIREKLLVNLVDKENTAEGIASIIRNNFDKLPANIREKFSYHKYAWYNKGVAFEAAGEFFDAIEWYDIVLKIDNTFSSAWFNKTSIHYNMGNLDKALETIDEYARLQPKDARAWYIKANICEDLKYFDRAIECYDKAIELDPLHYNAIYSKGLLLGKLGNKEEELKCYEIATDVLPAFIDAWYNKGIVAFELGKVEYAVSCFQQVNRIDARHIDAWFNEGIALLRLGKRIEAAKCYLALSNLDKQWAEKLGRMLGLKIIDLQEFDDESNVSSDQKNDPVNQEKG